MVKQGSFSALKQLRSVLGVGVFLLTVVAPAARGTPTPTAPVPTQQRFCEAASAADGRVNSTGLTYPPAGAPVLNTTSGTIDARRSLRPAGDYSVGVMLLRFDTSALPDDAIITTARLEAHVTGTSNASGRTLVAEFYPASNWPITARAYADVAPTASKALEVPVGGLVAGQVASIVMDPLLADQQISRVGSTGLRLHISGGQPTGTNYVEMAAQDHTTLPDPCLVIDYVRTPGAPTATPTPTPTPTPSPGPIAPTATPTPPPTGQLQVCATASGDDGFAFRLATTYPPGGTITVNTTAASNDARRSRRTTGDYTVGVLLLRFDTAALPDDAVITAAQLNLNVTSAQNTDNRDLVGEFYAASNWPIDAADYTDGAPTVGVAATAAVSALSPGPVSIGLSPVLADQNISRTSVTALRFHISGGVPSGPNFVSLAAQDHTTLPEPCLMVTFVRAGVPTPTRTPTFTPTNTPTGGTPTFAPTNTPTGGTPTAGPFFQPLLRTDAACVPGQTNWYGMCVNFFKIFGHPRIGEVSENLVTLTKGADICGAAVDKSVTPNRIYLADCAHNRVMGWSSLGTCGDGSPCTQPTDCAPNDPCVADPMKPADITIPPVGSSTSCNGDGNIGNLGPASADAICLMDVPQNSNMAESYYSLPIEVDEHGNLLVPDLYNNRFVEYREPFSADRTAGKGDGIVDFVWGQKNFTDNQPNEGRGYGSPSATSLKFYEPFRDYKGRSGITRAPDGSAWAADQSNSRVLHYPAGSAAADICLGQPDCETQATDYGYCTGSPTNTAAPLNVICQPVVARIKPATGELYVLDGGMLYRPYDGRILVFTPPFRSGMFASRSIKPKLTTIYAADGGAWPYIFAPLDFEFNEYAGTPPYDQGDVWVVDGGPNYWWTQNRLLLLDADGDVLATIGATAPDQGGGQAPDGCGDIMNRWYMWGGAAFGVSGPMIVTSSMIPNTAARYLLPVSNWTTSTDTCQPLPASGLLDSSNFWGQPSPETMKGPNRLAVAGGQLIVCEDQYTKVWNDYASKPWGAAPDFETNALGDGWDNFAHLAVDDAGHLWRASSQGLFAFSLPLTATSAPIVADSNLYWADDGTQVDFPLGPENHHLLFDHVRKRLLVADPIHGRILGVSNYASVEAPGVKLLVDWVQGQPDKASELSCNQGLAAPTAATLCSGGQMAIDSTGNLYVNDMAATNWDTACGNNRVLVYLSSDISGTPGMFPQLSAKRVINHDGRYDTPGPCGVYQASTIAVDGHDRLWITGHGDLGYAPTDASYWELTALTDPLNNQKADRYVRIPSGYSPDIQFDSDNDNLLLLNSSWAQVTAINVETDPSWLSPLPSYRFRFDNGTQPFALEAGGASFTINFGVLSVDGTFQPFVLSVAGLPSGVSATWLSSDHCDVPSCANGGAYSLRLTASASAAPGAYAVHIVGTTLEGYQRTLVAPFRVAGALSCAGPATAAVDQTVAFSAKGGTGVVEFYSWTGGGSPATGLSGLFDTSFASSGTKTVTVSLAAQTATCTIDVGP